MTEILNAALDYAGRAWPVLPVQPGRKLPATTHGFKDASTDPATVRQWWACWPRANVGIRTGLGAGLVVLDVDVPHGYPSLARLASTHGSLPVTPTVVTPRGGRHFYFAHPGVGSVPNSAGKLGHGLDVRGDGGYVVAPPSVTADGAYTWSDGDRTPAPCPAWLLAALRPQPVPPAIARRRLVVLPGGRYVSSALRGEVDRVRSAPKGNRNDTLNRAAFALGTLVGSGMLDAGIAGRALLDAALDAGLDEQESRATILSGLNKGADRPRQGVSA